MPLLKLHRIGLDGIREEDHLPGQPFVLVLGGLLHFNGQQLGSTFCRTIHFLTQKHGDIPAFTLTAPQVPFGEIVEDLCAFSDPKNRKIGQIAHEITKRFVLPDTLLQGLIKANQHEATQALIDHMSCINLLGYCYGSGLIQQIEILAHDRLKKFTEDNNHLSFEHLATSLKSIWAVNIAPSAVPSVLDPSNVLVPANIYDSRFASEGAYFRQFFAVRYYDKICHDLSGKAFRPPYRVSFMKESKSSIIIGDKVGDSFIRRAGLQKNANGFYMPRVDYSLDHEGHSLLLYVNNLDLNDNMISFPSSLTARAIHHAMYQLCSRAYNIRNITDQFNAACFTDFQNPERRVCLLNYLRDIQKDFEQIVRLFAKMDLQASRQYLQEKVDYYSQYQGQFSTFDLRECQP